MKKRKRRMLNERKEAKRLEWERIKTMQEEDSETLVDDPEIFEDAVFGTLYMHFIEDEYGCHNCNDFVSGCCEGKGYTIFDECYGCMKDKVKRGQITMMTSFRYT